MSIDLSKTFDHAEVRMISASAHADLLKFMWQTVWENKRTISNLIFQLARDKRVLSSRLSCLPKCQSQNEKNKTNRRIRMQKRKLHENCNTSNVSLNYPTPSYCVPSYFGCTLLSANLATLSYSSLSYSSYCYSSNFSHFGCLISAVLTF